MSNPTENKNGQSENAKPRETRGPEAFSLFDPAVLSDPFPFYHAMHEKCPVYKLPENGFYVASRYEDIEQAVQDPGTFSNVMERAALLQGENTKAFQKVLRERGWEHCPTLQRSDPPQHARYRKIIDRALNIKQVRNLTPHMTDVVNALIDSFIDQGECDFIEQFAFPFPGTIIAELIGLEGADWPRYRSWADNVLSYSTRVLTLEELMRAAEIEIEMQHFFADILNDRRQNPREDLMTALVTTPENEQPLTMHELQNVMHQLISGGYETVPSALNHAIWQLIRFPEVATKLRENPSLVRSFIDESLRWESPVQGHVRAVVKDTELGGTAMPKGSFCMFRWGAANRDDAFFPDADTFDINRDNADQHFAFGRGPHFCPGAMLARQELTIAVNVILDRMDDIALAQPMPDPVHKPSMPFFQMKQLKIKFRKRVA